MHSDGREIWDWAARLGAALHMQDELMRLSRQLIDNKTTCGSCASWMTDSCPRERHDNRTGRKQGPSCAAIKCDKFRMTGVAVARDDELIREIKALLVRLNGKTAQTIDAARVQQAREPK